MEDGFYKLDRGTVLYAPNFVYNKDYELHRDSLATFVPIDGWYWFETLIEAGEALGFDHTKYTTDEFGVLYVINQQ